MQNYLQDTEQLKEKKKIKNWIIPSLLVAIFLFFLTGIPALFFAIVSRIKLKNNNIEGAQKTARTARALTIISLWIGIPLTIAEIIYYLNTGKTFEYFWFM